MGAIPSQDRTKKYLSDVYISSYTPTLFAFIKSREPSTEPSDRPPSLLVIAPPGRSLPGVRKEMGIIRRVLRSIDPVLRDATSEMAGIACTALVLHVVYTGGCNYHQYPPARKSQNGFVPCKLQGTEADVRINILMHCT
jgi:hypothetical protein